MKFNNVRIIEISHFLINQRSVPNMWSTSMDAFKPVANFDADTRAAGINSGTPVPRYQLEVFKYNKPKPLEPRSFNPSSM